MQPIEIIVIVGVVVVLALIIVGGIMNKARAKKKGVSCCGCAGCRHADNCGKSKGVEADDSKLSSIVTDLEKQSCEDVDNKVVTDKSDT